MMIGNRISGSPMNRNKFKANNRSEIVSIANRKRLGWVEVETCHER